MSPASSSVTRPVEGLRADLGWALGVVFRTYIKTVGERLTEIPGGPRGYLVLSAAVHDPSETQLALAQRLGIDRTVMTYLLDDLTSAGLVERQRDPLDRRARRVLPTELGAARLCHLEAVLREAEDLVLRGLDSEDRLVFRELLQRVALDIAAERPTATPCEVAAELGIETPRS
jgi:DNA-binding MarR family transcriptional regulator